MPSSLSTPESKNGALTQLRPGKLGGGIPGRSSTARITPKLLSLCLVENRGLWAQINGALHWIHGGQCLRAGAMHSHLAEPTASHLHMSMDFMEKPGLLNLGLPEEQWEALLCSCANSEQRGLQSLASGQCTQLHGVRAKKHSSLQKEKKVRQKIWQNPQRHLSRTSQK